MADESSEVEQTGRIKSLLLKLLPYILVLALGAFGGIYTAQQKPSWFGLAKGQAQAQAEVDALVTQVGKLINLPTDEKPTVATVTDASKITDQPFFTNAKNDDKVLIYQKAQKAILFRPSENRIIEVGSLNINQTSAETPTPTPTGKAKATPTPEVNPTETPAQ